MLSSNFDAYQPEALLDSQNRMNVAGYGFRYADGHGTPGRYYVMSLGTTASGAGTSSVFASMVGSPVSVGTGDIAFATQLPGDYTRPAFVHFTRKSGPLLVGTGQRRRRTRATSTSPAPSRPRRRPRRNPGARWSTTRVAARRAGSRARRCSCSPRPSSRSGRAIRKAFAPVSARIPGGRRGRAIVAIGALLFLAALFSAVALTLPSDAILFTLRPMLRNHGVDLSAQEARFLFPFRDPSLGGYPLLPREPARRAGRDRPLRGSGPGCSDGRPRGCGSGRAPLSRIFASPPPSGARGADTFSCRAFPRPISRFRSSRRPGRGFPSGRSRPAGT